jgi:hypothetical protein
MCIAMFVFNPCTRDPRVDREASLLARHGHEVRVHAFLEPGLPEREARNGYEVVRADQRSKLQRLVDDKLLGPLKERRKRRAVEAAPAPEPLVAMSTPLNFEPAVGGRPRPGSATTRPKQDADAQGIQVGQGAVTIGGITLDIRPEA